MKPEIYKDEGFLNYMRIARQPVGYLVKFGHKDTLQWKRFILSEFTSQAHQPTTTDFSSPN